MLEPIVITSNKLEAAFLGDCSHVLRDVTSTKKNESATHSSSTDKKLRVLNRIVTQLSYANGGIRLVVFVNSTKQMPLIATLFQRRALSAETGRQPLHFDMITRATRLPDIKAIENRWNKSSRQTAPLALVNKEFLFGFDSMLELFTYSYHKFSFDVD